VILAAKSKHPSFPAALVSKSAAATQTVQGSRLAMTCPAVGL
jgi:hypothetical protein